MEDAIFDRALKRLHQQSLNIIDGYISSYCSILNSPRRLHMIKQAKELASVLCDIQSDRLGTKEDRKKIEMEAEDQGGNKYEQNHIRDDDEKLKDLETCEVLVRSVL